MRLAREEVVFCPALDRVRFLIYCDTPLNLWNKLLRNLTRIPTPSSWLRDAAFGPIYIPLCTPFCQHESYRKPPWQSWGLFPSKPTGKVSPCRENRAVKAHQRCDIRPDRLGTQLGGVSEAFTEATSRGRTGDGCPWWMAQTFTRPFSLARWGVCSEVELHHRDLS